MDNIPFEIGDTAKMIRREFERRAACHGATPAQWRVLARLSRMGEGARQVDLADALDVEPMSLGRMVDRLEQAGLVVRRRDEEDRRAWRVHLTSQAGPVVGKLRALGETFMDEALAGIAEADLETARRTLAQIRDNLSKDGAGAAGKTL